MRIAAHQPNYLPNLGFFNKMSQVDKFIVFTNTQFAKEDGWQQRHKIKGPGGDLWLTVPVLGSQNQVISDVMINNSVPWRRKHSKTLASVYRKTQEQEALARLLDIYNQPWERLADLNYATIFLLRELLGIQTSVKVDEEVGGEKEQLLINLCEKYGADAYLSGMGGKHYMTEEYFKKLTDRGIAHNFVENDLTSPYPYSAFHYIFTDGVEQTAALLTTCKAEPAPVLS